ncbi:hypothetical protein [Kribbia dieselivorans]|uniref:hypothetical protein n=1 Tax=Kribbia dieselivorans TaxID=331526 RepID=UPI000837B31A|nr:hypothetical protein [Kribbia dieselivorans]
MFAPLTALVYATSAVLGVMALWYLVRKVVINDRLLIVAAVLEVLVIVQAVWTTVNGGHIADVTHRATFLAYSLTLPFIPAALVFIAIKEKTGWAMGAIVVGVIAIATMTLRLHQIWTVYA